MSSPTPRPTLEELLRFKRAERPSPEFWAEFDRGLRQKQLAALMKRPQGWARVRPVLVRGLRWAVPATAAAAVALVILQTPNSVQTTPTPVVAAVAPQPITVPAAPVVQPVAQVVAAVETPRSEAALQERKDVAVVAQAEPVVVTPLVAEERTLSWSAAAFAQNDTPSYRVPGMHSVRQAAPEARRPNSSWTSRFSEMVRELSAQQSEDRVLQLASMNLPGSYQSVQSWSQAGTNQLVASNDRPGRGLSDREVRDLDSRFGVKGSSLSIRF
jgi:hypothetical protein